jgi:hypothetical protein
VGDKKTPQLNAADVFSFLKTVLRQPRNTRGASGLAAYDACKQTLGNEDLFKTAGQTELETLYTVTHAFVGVLAESRCFAAFAFWAGFFGRIPEGNPLVRMREIGDFFMDTHNQCWGAWAAMGKDYKCQPDLYLDQFIQPETRQKLVEYVDGFRANDEKAMRVLDELCGR